MPCGICCPSTSNPPSDRPPHQSPFISIRICTRLSRLLRQALAPSWDWARIWVLLLIFTAFYSLAGIIPYTLSALHFCQCSDTPAQPTWHLPLFNLITSTSILCLSWISADRSFAFMLPSYPSLGICRSGIWAFCCSFQYLEWYCQSQAFFWPHCSSSSRSF